MSLSTESNFTCPRCGSDFPVTVWNTVNVALDPKFRQLVLERAVRAATCPICGQRITYDADLMYHDMDRLFMISLIHSKLDRPFVAPTRLLEASKELQPNYRLRFVTSYNQLREKILIFEAGLHDHVIETIKLVVWINRFPSRRPTDDSLYFCSVERDATESLVIIFQLVDGGKDLGLIQVPHAMYAQATAAAGEKLLKEGLGEWKLVNQSMFPHPADRRKNAPEVKVALFGCVVARTEELLDTILSLEGQNDRERLARLLDGLHATEVCDETAVEILSRGSGEKVTVKIDGYDGVFWTVLSFLKG